MAPTCVCVTASPCPGTCYSPLRSSRMQSSTPTRLPPHYPAAKQVLTLRSCSCHCLGCPAEQYIIYMSKTMPDQDFKVRKSGHAVRTACHAHGIRLTTAIWTSLSLSHKSASIHAKVRHVIHWCWKALGNVLKATQKTLEIRYDKSHVEQEHRIYASK